MTHGVLDRPATRHQRTDFDHAWLKSSLVMIMTMRADDAKHWNADSMVELARSFSLGALGFSVGGVTAFYPTAVEGHPVNLSLAGRDLVGQTVDALPKEDWNDPAWKRYNEWRYARVADWNQRVKAVVVATRPSCAWLPLSQTIESWDHTRTGGWDVDLTSPHADGVVLEAQRRYCNLWWPGMEARHAHAMGPERGAGITVSYFYPWWPFTYETGAENRALAVQIVANS